MAGKMGFSTTTGEHILFAMIVRNLRSSFPLLCAQNFVILIDAEIQVYKLVILYSQSYIETTIKLCLELRYFIICCQCQRIIDTIIKLPFILLCFEITSVKASRRDALTTFIPRSQLFLDNDAILFSITNEWSKTLSNKSFITFCLQNPTSSGQTCYCRKFLK